MKEISEEKGDEEVFKNKANWIPGEKVAEE